LVQAADLLRGRARLNPHREALLELESGRRYTYLELNERSCRAANFLRHQLGIQKGDRVSILAHNGVPYIDLLYGLAKIGAVFAPLNWRLVASELVYIVDDCKPKVIVCGAEFTDTLAAMRGQLNIDHVVTLEGVEIPGAISYEDGLRSASTLEPEQPELDGETPLCILYTSGTTGRPKGAVIPHRQVVWNCINTAISWGLVDRDVSPIFTPLFHAGGLFAFMAPIFYVGGRIVLTRQFDANDSIKTIQDEACTVILGVPTLFQMWMKSDVIDAVDFSSVRFFISGGAPCPIPLMATWREKVGTVLRQGYGLTEVGPNCFTMTDKESKLKSGSVGKPILHSRVRLVDGDGEDVPSGTIGELIIQGPHVSTGYWKDARATEEAHVDGWFHTGDMARVDEDGFFTISGRVKDMIITGGENVYAAEVEAVFLDHPGVAECALIGKPDEKWGESGLMIVVLQPGSSVDARALKEFCKGHLASFKIPAEIIFTAELRYSAYGKVIKSKLREIYL
jgi:fatty-acyl-CoA synthase